MLAADNYLVEHVAGPDGMLNDAKSKTFWTQFQGEAVVGYTKDDAKMGHAILVRSAASLSTPVRPRKMGSSSLTTSNESGKITITSVSTVTRMLPQ